MKNVFFKSALVVLLGLTPLFSETVFGQNNDFGAFVNETFQNHLNNLTITGNSSSFLAAFDQNLVWVDVDVAIDGRVSMKKNDKDYLQKVVYRANANKSLRVTWDIVKFNELTSRENTYMGSFEVDVHIYADNELLSSGKNFVEVLAKKPGEKFVIQYISVVQISNKSYKGRCFLETRKENETYYTILTFPNGTDYESQENQIQFIGSDNLRPVKLNPGNQTFYWNTIEKIVSKEQSGSIRIGGTTIGSEDAVIKLLLQDQNSNKCTHIIPLR